MLPLGELILNWVKNMLLLVVYTLLITLTIFFKETNNKFYVSVHFYFNKLLRKQRTCIVRILKVLIYTCSIIFYDLEILHTYFDVKYGKQLDL